MLLVVQPELGNRYILCIDIDTKLGFWEVPRGRCAGVNGSDWSECAN